MIGEIVKNVNDDETIVFTKEIDFFKNAIKEQRELNKKYLNEKKIDLLPKKGNPVWLFLYYTDFTAEKAELIESFYYKHWTKEFDEGKHFEPIDKDNVKVELIDLLHFYLCYVCWFQDVIEDICGVEGFVDNNIKFILAERFNLEEKTYKEIQSMQESLENFSPQKNIRGLDLVHQLDWLMYQWKNYYGNLQKIKNEIDGLDDIEDLDKRMQKKQMLNAWLLKPLDSLIEMYLLFIISANFFGMDLEEIENLYFKKNKLNKMRQEGEYSQIKTGEDDNKKLFSPDF